MSYQGPSFYYDYSLFSFHHLMESICLRLGVPLLFRFFSPLELSLLSLTEGHSFYEPATLRSQSHFRKDDTIFFLLLSIFFSDIGYEPHLERPSLGTASPLSFFVQSSGL